MARKVFFSFHFERDYWRAGQVRGHWLTKPDRKSAGYWDAGDWEKIKRQDDDAIKRWIKNSLSSASVTAVLIGAETSTRKWVDYEIEQSFKDKMGMIGIYIHNIKDRNSLRDTRGTNPFNLWHYTAADESKKYFSEKYDTYDWVDNNGYVNFGAWIEKAAKDAGR